MMKDNGLEKSNSDNTQFLGDIRKLIEHSRQNVVKVVNAELSLLYWNIGKRINEEFLLNERAKYGKQILITLAQQLTDEYGKGWSERMLNYCIKFAQTFPEQIPNTVCSEFSWSHIKQFIAIDDKLKRDFYIEMCKLGNWSVRTLHDRIDKLMYERTAISNKPDETIRQELDLLKNEGEMTPDLAFRDPYILDFLGLRDCYSEKDLEAAILEELQKFIIEFGDDFAFMARQKMITIDNENYFIDLLFYHRLLRRLVVIELKIGSFRAEHKGQMELYLRWLEQNMHRDGEELPIGLILCSGKNEKHVELLELDKSNIKVASYMIGMPDKHWLQDKLALSIERAKNRLVAKDGDDVGVC